MAAHLLASALSGLTISGRPQALSSSRNGICSCKRVVLHKPQQVTLVATEAVCGKMKTRKAVQKRFKITGAGKVVRRRPGKQHINEKMSRAKIRSLGKQLVVSDTDLPNIAPSLPYAGLRQSRN